LYTHNFAIQLTN